MTEPTKDKEVNKNTVDENPAGEKNTETNDSQPGPIPYDRFKEVNSKAKELEAKLLELQKKESEREEEAERKRAERLKEQEKYKELADEFESKFKDIEPKYNQTVERVESLETMLEKYSESQMSLVPEIFREVVKKMPLVERIEWLTENSEKLGKEKPKGVPNTPEAKGQGELTREERLKRAARTF